MGEIGFITPELKRIERLARGGALGLFHFAELRPLAGVTGLVDWRMLGHLSQLKIEGFVDGTPDETLLFPLGGRLPQDCLLLLGLGERERFSEHAFRRALRRLFEQLVKLDQGKLTLALPGRVEGLCEIGQAIEWFLPIYESFGQDRNVVIVEPAAAQKEMGQIIERWHLKREVS
jgi:hypothetical protein